MFDRNHNDEDYWDDEYYHKNLERNYFEDEDYIEIDRELNDDCDDDFDEEDDW